MGIIELLLAGKLDTVEQLLNLRNNAICRGNKEVLNAVNLRLKEYFPAIYKREVGHLEERHRDKQFRCYCNNPKSLYQVYQDIKDENVPNDALRCEDCWGIDIKGAWGYYGWSKKRISKNTWKKLCDLRIEANRENKFGDYQGTVHCPDCVEGKACGHFHVYVIELRREVLRKGNGFPFEGELDTNKKVYYVGQTLHSVECRYKQHVAVRNRNSRQGFYCSCFSAEEKYRAFTKFNRPGKYVTKYHKKEGLRPELYFRKNPTVRTEPITYKGMMEDLKKRAEKEEERLAHTLRSQGHAVHYN